MPRSGRLRSGDSAGFRHQGQASDAAERPCAIHQPAIDQGFGKATEIEIQAKEMLRMREWLEETLAKHTGQDVEKIRRDIEVDTFLTADEAKDYGIVDEVLAHRQ